MDVIKVLLADDHPALRAGIKGMLEKAGIEVVGEAADGGAALRLAEKLRPDVLVLDAVMPGRGRRRSSIAWGRPALICASWC
jgi:DNA-binding NarL/FixJ family response regulator